MGYYRRGELEAMDKDALFRAQESAYAHQGYVVDNGGSDQSSWDAERRCDEVSAEIDRRGLEEEYWAWSDQGITERRFGRDHDQPCKNPNMISCRRPKCQNANACQLDE